MHIYIYTYNLILLPNASLGGAVPIVNTVDCVRKYERNGHNNNKLETLKERQFNFVRLSLV